MAELRITDWGIDRFLRDLQGEFDDWTGKKEYICNANPPSEVWNEELEDDERTEKAQTWVTNRRAFFNNIERSAITQLADARDQNYLTADACTRACKRVRELYGRYKEEAEAKYDQTLEFIRTGNPEVLKF